MSFINFKWYERIWEIIPMDEDFAEYTKCLSCNQALLYCNCNCPYCGKREDCRCELQSLSMNP